MKTKKLYKISCPSTLVFSDFDEAKEVFELLSTVMGKELDFHFLDSGTKYTVEPIKVSMDYDEFEIGTKEEIEKIRASQEEKERE